MATEGSKPALLDQICPNIISGKGYKLRKLPSMPLTFVSCSPHDTHVTARDLDLGPVWSPLFKRARTFACIRRIQPVTIPSPCIIANDIMLSPTQPDNMMSFKFVQSAALACIVLCYACPASAVPISNPTSTTSGRHGLRTLAKPRW